MPGILFLWKSLQFRKNRYNQGISKMTRLMLLYEVIVSDKHLIDCRGKPD